MLAAAVGWRMEREPKVTTQGPHSSSHPSFVDDILRANARFAASEAARDLPGQASYRGAIVLCMDARIDPIRVLGLPPGTAHIIRNAGGRMAEALRSIAISQQVMGTREVALVHHTDCGMATFTNDDLRRRLHEVLGADATGTDFLAFSGLEESVREDLGVYRASAIVRQDIPVRGFICDISTGRLREVFA